MNDTPQSNPAPVLDPDSVFDSFWATALEDAQGNENESACEESREPEEIEGEPATEYESKYRDAVKAICEQAEPLIAIQNLGSFPRVCPEGDLNAIFGSDLYMTAHGHGVGFWDGDWDPVGDELTAIVKSVGGLSGDLSGHINGGLYFL